MTLPIHCIISRVLLYYVENCLDIIVVYEITIKFMYLTEDQTINTKLRVLPYLKFNLVFEGFCKM